tara:strand:+ start:121 stop:468 length:348 start_codon:yes stop_codon:yes gene_type:complete
MWFDILKIQELVPQELVPKEEPLDIELDAEASNEGCCQEARTQLLAWYLQYENHPDNPISPKEYQDTMTKIEEISCQGLKIALLKSILNLTPQEPGYKEFIKINNEWKECEGGSF